MAILQGGEGAEQRQVESPALSTDGQIGRVNLLEEGFKFGVSAQHAVIVHQGKTRLTE